MSGLFLTLLLTSTPSPTAFQVNSSKNSSTPVSAFLLAFLQSILSVEMELSFKEQVTARHPSVQNPSPNGLLTQRKKPKAEQAVLRAHMVCCSGHI